MCFENVKSLDGALKTAGFKIREKESNLPQICRGETRRRVLVSEEKARLQRSPVQSCRLLSHMEDGEYRGHGGPHRQPSQTAICKSEREERLEELSKWKTGNGFSELRISSNRGQGWAREGHAPLSLPVFLYPTTELSMWKQSRKVL